jgi:hypothetical protein
MQSSSLVESAREELFCTLIDLDAENPVQTKELIVLRPYNTQIPNSSGVNPCELRKEKLCFWES